MDPHVQYILSQYAQRMYLLKLLRHQGMSYAQLTVVTYSIIISRLIYALPAWGGFLSTELVGKINALFRRLKRFGYLSCNITVSDLMIDSDTGLFRKMYSPSHWLHHPVLECVTICVTVDIIFSFLRIALLCTKSPLSRVHCITLSDCVFHVLSF